MGPYDQARPFGERRQDLLSGADLPLGHSSAFESLTQPSLSNTRMAAPSYKPWSLLVMSSLWFQLANSLNLFFLILQSCGLVMGPAVRDTLKPGDTLNSSKYLSICKGIQKRHIVDKWPSKLYDDEKVYQFL